MGSLITQILGSVVYLECSTERQSADFGECFCISQGSVESKTYRMNVSLCLSFCVSMYYKCEYGDAMTNMEVRE